MKPLSSVQTFKALKALAEDKSAPAAKRVNKRSQAYMLVLEAIAGHETKIRPVNANRFYHFYGVMDFTEPIEYILTLLGIEYTVTNDAPRGGRAGALITLQVQWV